MQLHSNNRTALNNVRNLKSDYMRLTNTQHEKIKSYTIALFTNYNYTLQKVYMS